MWGDRAMMTTLGPQNSFMDRFALEPKTQRVWKIRHATWFTMMGVGGAVFILARVLRYTGELGIVIGIPVEDLISFVAIAVGGMILINYLTRPFFVWRTFSNFRNSWITWGATSDVIFLICGGLLVLPDLELGGSHPFSGLPWDSQANTASGHFLEILGGIAAVFVVFYAGAVLAAPRAIPYWHSPAVPLQFMASSGAMAMGVLMFLHVLQDEPLSGGQFGLTALFTALLAVMILWHVSTGKDVPGKSHSLRRLLRGIYRRRFVGGVVVVGTLVPLVLVLIGWAAGSARDSLAVISTVLLIGGGFGLRLYTLRVGIYPPVVTLASSGRTPAVSV